MISVLFARSDSVYKALPGCDVWDQERNALFWPGGNPCGRPMVSRREREATPFAFAVWLVSLASACAGSTERWGL